MQSSKQRSGSGDKQRRRRVADLGEAASPPDAAATDAEKLRLAAQRQRARDRAGE